MCKIPGLYYYVLVSYLLTVGTVGEGGPARQGWGFGGAWGGSVGQEGIIPRDRQTHVLDNMRGLGDRGVLVVVGLGGVMASQPALG